jgi:protein-tyrosine phosphatase
MTKVLLVCTANICRSPMALSVMHKLVSERGLTHALHIESAGTHAASPPQSPDPRALAALLRRGYKPGKKRSTRITAAHFGNFDLLLAMDSENLAALRNMCPAEHVDKLRLFLSYAPETGYTEIPDPYYGNAAGFELVLDLCETAAANLVRSYAL